jgi:hypothetical protein
MERFIWCLLIIISFIAAPSFAAQPDKRSEKADYQKEIEKLKKENPKEYEEMKKDFVFTAQLVLAGLGFGIGPFDGILDDKTKSALRTYQKKRNIPETSDPLSFDTVEQLKADMDTSEYHPISLPGFHVFTDLWDKGYVSASGTWVLSNDRMGEPEQTSKINCSRNLNTCTEAIAIVQGKGSDRRLFIDTDTYEIERWDDHEIVTKPLQTAFGCVRYLRRINRLQKSVTGIRSTISDKDVCKGVDPKEMHMVLTDGFKVYWDLLQERNKKWRQLLNISPTLLQYLESGKKEKAK